MYTDMTETLTSLPATLRKWAYDDSVGPDLAHYLCRAADEIERLTADNIMLRTERTVFGKTVDRAIADGRAKIERLTAENAHLKAEIDFLNESLPVHTISLE